VFHRAFPITDTYSYNLAGPRRWVNSHILRYKYLLAVYILAVTLANGLAALALLLVGQAFNAVLAGSLDQFLHVIPMLLGVAVLSGCSSVGARFVPALVGKRLERDARAELYLSLLGKSQTFHNRQRVGDIMARAASDIAQLSSMILPGCDVIFDSYMNLSMTIIFIGLLSPQLLLVPLLFLASFLISLRFFLQRLAPISEKMRKQFGELNAALNETLSGIEVVKATVQEEQEKRKFEQYAERYRDFFVANGFVQSWYLPPLLLAIALVFAFLHALFLVAHNQISAGSLVAFISLMITLRYPTFNSNWSFSLVQLGIASATRILAILKAEAEQQEDKGIWSGNGQKMRGEIIFEHVSFSYEGKLVLKDVSFRAEPGQTIAIIGQTGAGKSTLTRLINRIYDVDAGRILIDGVDVRDWKLEVLRSQIATIEQDIFLFSRSIAENIAYGLGQQTDHEAIRHAASDAQAHQFIMGFKEGYQTIVGERGMTLSGGQRQRLAIARALLTDPRILILDDATSAIDSATENEIQRAINRVLEERTTFLITQRLSQIRQADRILVLRQGELLDQGTHNELLSRCETYRRIFAYSAPTQPVRPTAELQELHTP
jgi:ATP-binding cassette, subfamily B, bacterial